MLKKLLFFSLTCLAANQFNGDVLRVIDTNSTTQNIFFRGNIPWKDSIYQVNGLKNHMRDLFEEYKADNPLIGVAWDTKAELSVVSTLTFDTTVEKTFLERLYYYYNQVNGTPTHATSYHRDYRGEWVWWQVNPYVNYDEDMSGDVTWAELTAALDPIDSSDVESVLLNQTWDGNTLNFVGLIEHLNTLVDTDFGEPRLIFVHSQYGVNRSTAVETAYRMRHLGEDLETAYDNAITYPDGTKVYPSEPKGLKAFLYYYKRYLDLFTP
ncbi:MAG: hypothetical protein MRY21_05230 [Simkaniaceae bacterium]|nr:hypothetical protein [Simkaniaceae bacterium]